MSNQGFNLALLPPNINFLPILKLIIDAHDAVSHYDAVFSNMQNNSFLLNISQSNEATLSSRIEGTQASLEDVLRFNKDKKLNISENERLDVVEILNYRLAIRQGQQLLDRGASLSEEMIKQLHKTLLNSARGSQFSPGEYKKSLNWIGKTGCRVEEAIYVPPGPSETPRLMANLCEYLRLEADCQGIVQIAIGHYQFESIHPFRDGNGRIGRLMVPLCLYEKKITSSPNLYISEFIENHKADYYKFLDDVHKTNNWIQWLEFFLIAVRNQSRLLRSRATKIEALYSEMIKDIASFNSIFASDFIKTIFREPVFTAKLVKEKTDIKHINTVNRLIEKFQQRDYLKPYGPKVARSQSYIFQKLLDIVHSGD